MKIIYTIFIYFSFSNFCFSQIPNADFEDWITSMNGIESPQYWETNNFYTSSTPADKELNSIQGKYSLKLSSTALSTSGKYTEPGCAHVKFIPTKYFNYFNFCIRIDSIYSGQISVRVKQLASSGMYERIGGWNNSNKTKGIEFINVPILQTSLDTILIEIWALKQDDFLLDIIGYSEAVFDLLSISTEPNNVRNIEFNSKVNISIDNSNKILKVTNNALTTYDLNLNILDTQGKLMKVFNLYKDVLNTYDLEFLICGVYFITISDNQKILYCKKIRL